jgi:thiol-disulfide isomerase/thioredoxin
MVCKTDEIVTGRHSTPSYHFPPVMRTLLVLAVALAGASASAEPQNLIEVRNRSDVTRAFAPSSKIRVVNFWATWCYPCVAEMPDLQAVADACGNDVELIGVSFDDAIPGSRTEAQARVRRFLDTRRIKFKIAYYIGKVSKLAEEYEFDGEIPVTIVFDPAGRELMRHQGVIDRDQFMKQIQELLRTHTARKEKS